MVLCARVWCMLWQASSTWGYTIAIFTFVVTYLVFPIVVLMVMRNLYLWQTGQQWIHKRPKHLQPE